MALSMTVIRDDRVYMVCDSFNMFSRKNLEDPSNFKLWTPEGCKETIVTINGSIYRKSYIKRYDEAFAKLEEEGISKDSLMHSLLPRVIGEAMDYDMAKGDDKLEHLDFNILLATGDRAYLFNGSGSVRKLGEVEPICYSPVYFISALDELKDSGIDTIDQILIAIFGYQRQCEVICFPVVIKDTKTMKEQLFYYEDLLEVARKHNRGGDF